MFKLIGRKEVQFAIIVGSAGLGFKFVDYVTSHNTRREWAEYSRNIKERQTDLRKIFFET